MFETYRDAAHPLRHTREVQDLWVAPKTSLTRQRDDAEWSIHPGASSDARLLELADIALGLRKPQHFRKRRSLFLAGEKL